MKSVRIAVSHATDEEALLNDLQAELERLSDTLATELETTLLAIPDMLEDFAQYNDFLDAVDLWVEQFGWEGELQASFHPNYQFADTELDEPGNLTNRPRRCCTSSAKKVWSRRSSTIRKRIRIPARNILRMEALSTEDKVRLFPYLFG